MAVSHDFLLLWLRGSVPLVKRHRTAALQKLRQYEALSNRAAASWSAPVLWRFRKCDALVSYLL